MSARALNLLRHPRQWPGGDGVQPWLFLAGVVCGAGLILLARIALQRQAPDWERTVQKARLSQSEQALQQQKAHQLRALSRRWQQESARDQSWQHAQQTLARVQQSLNDEAGRSGLRLHEWQGDGQRMRWQGSLTTVDALPALQQRLEHNAPMGWRLSSLEQAPDGRWRVAMEASPAAYDPVAAKAGGQP